MNRTYFPSLTGLRAIAAFTVLFTHVERYRSSLGKTLLDMPFNSFIGGLAVSFFFVLSGFLISYLLLHEKEKTGTIDIGGFLKKRALRIWPLYYAALIAGYVISIYILKDTSPNLLANGFLLNLFLLPNLAFALNLIPEILIQIWSIGTEEQFYFIWPFLVRKAPVHKLVRIFSGILLAWLLLRGGAHFLGKEYEWVNIFLYRTRIDCMAIGGLGALLLLYKDKPGTWMARAYSMVLHPLTGWIGGVLFCSLLLLSKHYDISFYQLYALLFGILILRMIHRPSRLLESAPLKYLGKISYGIYLLHQFAIYFLCRNFPSLTNGFKDSPRGDLVLFALAGLLAVLAASISYALRIRRRNTLSPYSALS